ncbi:MAG: hypothetical protein QOH86_1260, partial [Sphingomonadales bacterium]|nr:hypothetical protein [Sphingomonadales bacterium]
MKLSPEIVPLVAAVTLAGCAAGDSRSVGAAAVQTAAFAPVK